jgi:hypothetical protein
MYKVTLVLLAFFSLVLPILAVPVPVPDQVDGLEKLATTATFSGKVHAFRPKPADDADLSARREPILNLALVHVVKPVKAVILSSPFPPKCMAMDPIAGRCGGLLSPNMTRLDAFCRTFK